MQQTDCRAYAEQHGLAVVDVLNEDYTSTTIDRPVFNRLLELADAGTVEAVIVWHPDRLGRGPILELAITLLSNRGIAVHAANRGLLSDEDDETAQIQNSVDGMVSGIERRNIRRRVVRGMIEKVEKHLKLPGYGYPPYGYRWDGHGANRTLVKEKKEAQIVNFIFEWYVSGVSTRDICARLEAMHIPSPAEHFASHNKQAGRYKWITPTIYTILKRRTYIGEYVAFNPRPSSTRKPLSKTPVTVPCPAILSHTLFDAAQERLLRGNRFARRNNTRHTYLLRCLLRCRQCGKSICGMGRGRWYRCVATGNKHDMLTPCSVPLYRVAEVDETVWKWVVEHVLDDENLVAGLKQRMAGTEAERQRLTEEYRHYQERIAAIATEIVRLKELYLSGLFTMAEITADKKRLDEQRALLEEHSAEVERRLATLIVTPKQLEQLRATARLLRTKAETLSDEQKREILELLDTTVELYYDHGQPCACITVRLTMQSDDVQIVSKDV